jgi:uncharacterized protein YbaR (Trm112 family)
MATGSNPSNFPISFEKLKELLACPACEGKLRYEPQVNQLASPQVSDSLDRLVCSRCGVGYPIVDGIPLLIAGRA